MTAACVVALAFAGSAHASTLTVNMNDYDPAVDTTAGQTLATMTVKDTTLTGGGKAVSVDVSLTSLAKNFASTGGGHITFAFNLVRA